MDRFWKWTRNHMAGTAGAEEQPNPRILSFEGVIASESWYDDDITPSAFREELMQDTGPIILAINSPGGDCVAASMIYTMLKEYPGKITVRIEGIAASAASVVAMAGDVIQMSPTSLLMIHNPSTIAFGESADMAKAIRLLDETKESIINAYTIKTGLSRTKLSHMMDDETWLNAVKAKELGFCDEILYATSEQECDPEETPAFIFSQHEANLVLVNLLKEKHGKELQDNGKEAAAETSKEAAVPASETEKAELPETDHLPTGADESDPTVVVTDREENRTNAADLRLRLSLIK